MDSPYPYRIAWRPPPPVNVRSASRGAILDAMEYEFPTSKHRLADRTGLGDTTVRRACRQLSRERVMALKYGKDPDSGIAADLVTFARYPVLPILEITRAYMVWRLMDTRGGSVFATVRDRGGFCTPEDDLITLMGQARTIIKAGTCGLPADVPLQPPVLILPAREASMAGLVGRVVDAKPFCVLTPEAASAHELRFFAATHNAASVLYIRAGENCTVSLLQRANMDDLQSPFRPSPWTSGLSACLEEASIDLRPHTLAWWKAIAAFLTDCCRILTPEAILVESDKVLPDPRLLRNAIPSSIRFIHRTYALNTPSLAHQGAMRLTRRALWDSMESESPDG